MEDNLIPSIPATPEPPSDSSLDETSIPCGQSTPKRDSPTDLVQEDTRHKVNFHAQALIPLQEKIVHYTREIETVDRQATEGYVASHLRINKNTPKLPAAGTLSQEFQEAWLLQLKRTGIKLRALWRQELSKQAKRSTERFSEKKARATAELDDLGDGLEAQRLLSQKLRASKERLEKKTKQRRHDRRPRQYSQRK